MWALIVATLLCVAMVGTRALWMHRLSYGFLLWNLFLAWLPLAIALFAAEEYRKAGRLEWRLGTLAVAWLIFFPNAPYIFTDLIHLARFRQHYWVDLVLVLTCALTGLVVGFISFFLMQSVVKRLYGSRWSWGFVVGASLLSGFGIYIGRILRFNSWDVVVRPVAFSREIGRWASDPFASSQTFAFPALFGVFVLTSYLLFYALTHLRHPQVPVNDSTAK